jgi:hypothetical protein
MTRAEAGAIQAGPGKKSAPGRDQILVIVMPVQTIAPSYK